MALSCAKKDRIFTFNGKEYNYNEFRALMYDGLLERVPELTSVAKETLATEEGKEKVKEKISRQDELERLKRGASPKEGGLRFSKKPSKKAEVKDQAFDGIEEPKTPIGDTKTVMVGGKERTVFNSEGRPIHPTVEGVRNFWRWFGDSKVVDAEGRPQVMYHGAGADFDTFKPGEADAIFITASKELANDFASGEVGNIMPVYVKSLTPFDHKDADAVNAVVRRVPEHEAKYISGSKKKMKAEIGRGDWFVIEHDPVQDAIRGLGYDGFYLIEDLAGDEDTEAFAVYNPSQLKSAIGNYGTFDASKESINKMKSPRKMEAEDNAKMAKTGSSRMSNHGAKRLLGLIKPKLKVVEFAENEIDKFNETFKRLSGDTEIVASEEYDGFYDPSGDGTVYLIAKPGKQRVLAHEVMHPVFNVLFKGNPKLIDEFYAQIKADKRLEKYIEFGARYEPGMTEKMEAITDFLGAVADGELDEIFKKDPSLKQMVIDFIKKLLGYVGLSKDIEISGDMDMMTLAGLIHDAVRYNARLRVENISVTPENGIYTHIFGPIGELTIEERDGLAAAMAAHQNGATQEETKKLNGWFIGPDDKWRKYSEPFDAKLIGDPSDPDWVMPMSFNQDGDLIPGGVLQDIYDFPELYKKYPNFKYIPVEVKTMDDEMGGYWTGGLIAINKKYVNDKKFVLNIIAHEVQHAIQDEEGFVGGANKAYALYLLNKEQRKTYVNFVKNILDSAEADTKLYSKVNNFLSEQKNRKELINTFGNIEYAAMQMDSGLWEESIEELIEKIYGTDFRKNNAKKYIIVKAAIENQIENIYQDGGTGRQVIDLMATSFGGGVARGIQIARQYIESVEKDIYGNRPNAMDYLLEVEKIANDYVSGRDLKYLAYYMSYGEAEARRVGERVSGEERFQKEKETISPIEESDPIAKAGVEAFGQMSVYTEADKLIAQALASTKNKTFVASIIPEEGGLFFSKKKKSFVPVRVFNEAVDAAIKETKSIDSDWSQMTQMEKAKATADAAVNNLKNSKWYLGLELDGRKTAIKEVRSEIHKSLGAPLMTSAEKKAQQKGYREGLKEGKEAGKEEGKKEGGAAAKSELEAEKKAREQERLKAKEKIKAVRQRMNSLFEKIHEASRKGALAGEIHGRREERKKAQAELDKKLSAAEREKNKLAQKRLMQGYAQGVADGQLGGEIFGTRRGRKQAQQEMAKDRKLFVQLVRELFWDPNTGKMLLKGRTGRLQAYSIGRAAAMVNPSNPKHVAKFKEMVERIIEKATYTADLDAAKAAQAKARKAAKSKSLALNHRTTFDLLANIDLTAISNPAEYAERVNKYLAVTASVKSEKYQQMTQFYTMRSDEFGSSELTEYAEKLIKESEEHYKKMLIEEYGLNDVEGINAKEIYDALESGKFDIGYQQIEKNKKAEVYQKLKDSATYAKDALNEWYSDSKLLGIAVGQRMTERQTKIVDSLMKADFENMNARQLMQYVKAVDNIVMNDSFDNALKVAIISDISSNLKSAFESVPAPTIKALKGARMQTMSIADLNRYYWGLDGISAVVQQKMGVGKYINLKEKHNDLMNEIGEKVKNFYTDLNKTNPDAFSENSMALEGVVAYAIQSMPGLSVEEGFEVRKKILMQHIEKLAKRHSKEERATAAAQLKGYSDVLENSKTPSEALEKLEQINPAIKKSIDFLINISKGYKEIIIENARTLWNEGGTYDSEKGDVSDPYYIPIVHIKIAERATESIDADNAPRSMVSMLKTLPAQMKGRVRYNFLQENKLIDLNPRANTISRLNQNLYDATVGEALTYIAEFMDSPGVAENIFGDAENMEYYRELLSGWVAKYYQAERPDYAGKVINRAINEAREMAVAVRLGGIDQVVKQMPEALVQAVIMTGSADVFENLFKIQGPMAEDGANALMSKYAIGDRSSTIAGTEWQGLMSKHYREIQKALVADKTGRVLKPYNWLRKLATMPLSASDGIVAKAAWMAHYQYYRRKQGFEVESWNTESAQHDSDELRQQAAIYAETMVDYTMVSSDPTKASQLATKGKEWKGNLAKALFFMFSGFSIQSASRLAFDISDIYKYAMYKKSGNPDADKINVGRSFASLAARTSGAATYWSTAVYLAPLISQGLAWVIAEIINSSDDDDDDYSVFGALVATAIVMRNAGLLWSDFEKGFTLAAEDISKERINQRNKMMVNAFVKNPKIAEKIINTEETKKINQKALDKWNRFKIGLFSSLIGVDFQQNINNAIVDGVNYVSYQLAKAANSDSVKNKKGKEMDFKTWIKDQENPLFYRYEYRYGKTIVDEQTYGLIGIILGIPTDANRKLKKASDALEKAKGSEMDIRRGETSEEYIQRIKKIMEREKEKAGPSIELGKKKANEKMDELYPNTRKWIPTN